MMEGEFKCPTCGHKRPTVRNYWVELDVIVYALKCPKCGTEWVKRVKV
jgi:predicted RNA-binding Zn-ribbon protein involved in translation (DUF1610 family)